MRNLLLFFTVLFVVSASSCGVQAQPLQPWTLHISHQTDAEAPSIAWSGDGKTLAIATEDEIQIWNPRTKRRRRIIRVPDMGQLFEVTLSPHGEAVAGVFSIYQLTCALVLWDARSGRLLRSGFSQEEFRGHDIHVFWAPRRQFITGSAERVDEPSDVFYLTTHVLRSGKEGIYWQLSAPKGLNFIEFSLPQAGGGPSAPIWTVSPNTRRGAVALLNFVPTKNVMQPHRESGGVLVFDVRTGKHRRILPASLGGLQFSPDSRVLIVAGRDIELWDVKRSRLRLKVKQGAKYSAVAMSPNNNLLAVGNDRYADGGPYTIRLWNARNGRLVRELKGHRAAVTTLDFSPNGKTLASSSDDGTVKLWRVK